MVLLMKFDNSCVVLLLFLLLITVNVLLVFEFQVFSLSLFSFQKVRYSNYAHNTLRKVASLLTLLGLFLCSKGMCTKS